MEGSFFNEHSILELLKVNKNHRVLVHFFGHKYVILFIVFIIFVLMLDEPPTIRDCSPSVIESSIFPHAEMLQVMESMDKIRSIIGLQF